MHKQAWLVSIFAAGCLIGTGLVNGCSNSSSTPVVAVDGGDTYVPPTGDDSGADIGTGADVGSDDGGDTGTGADVGSDDGGDAASDDGGDAASDDGGDAAGDDGGDAASDDGSAATDAGGDAK